MTRFLAVMALGLPLLFTGCAQSEYYDTAYDQGTDVMAVAGTGAVNLAVPVGLMYAGADAATYASWGYTVNAPFHYSTGMIGGAAGAAVGVGYAAGSWVAPHEQDLADITLADFPDFAIGLTDPYQVLPPPFGTAYAPWKLVMTLYAGVLQPFHATGLELPFVHPAIQWADSFVQPIRSTVTASHTPVPGDGTRNGFLMARWDHQWRNFKHSGNTLKYWLFSTNSNLPPYDNFFPDQTNRDKTTILQTIDTFLFGFDWDDPYLP